MARGGAVEHERWATRFDFILACVGAGIGYGNVWRFPYLVYKNGGGAFFIPFFFSVFAAGLSVFFLEVIQGQFMSAGAIHLWRMAPLFQGIGVAAIFLLFCVNCYYNILLTWSFRYFFASFTAVLPWQTCDNEWNSDNCVVEEPIIENGTNGTRYITAHNVSLTSAELMTDPAIEYWEFISICNGIKTSSKIMYVTATSPYILIFVLMVRGLMLPGASLGIEFYLKPDFSKVFEPRVWADAGSQVFFSYAMSLGLLNFLGSCNPWRQNSLRDSVIFSFIDSFTCFITGFVIFPVLGHMAYMKGMAIEDVAEQGPGLVFVVFPKAVSLMPLAPLWSVLFFAMLILVGIDSQFVGVESFIGAITDLYPKQLIGTRLRRVLFTGGVCLVKLLIGLTMITNGGMYIFQILDYYSGSRIIMLVSMAECLVVAYVYGAERFLKNMEVMWQRTLSKPLKAYLKVSWMFVAPAYVFAQFIMNAVEYSHDLVYRRSATEQYPFPKWAIVFGWTLAYTGVLCIPLVAIIKLCLLPSTMSLKERVRHLMKPRLKPYMVLPGEHPDAYVPDYSDEDSVELSEDADGIKTVDRLISVETTKSKLST